MNRLLATLPVALAAIAAASTASAGALAGTYMGTSADGNGVTVVVATDTNGVLAATSATVFFSAFCSRDGSTLNTGWGYGTDQPITGRRVANVTASNYFTISYHLTFSVDGQTATGTIASISPTLTPVGPKPTKALFCRSASQAVTLTRQPGPARVVPPAQGAIFLGKMVHSAS